MRGTTLGRALITLAVLGLVVGAHALRVVSTPAIQHDDAISHLAATAHQGAYEESAPVGAWIPVADWARFWHLDDRPGQLATIGRDLARHDLHPPLYFWLLHGWIAAVGTQAWTGPALNLVLVALTALALLALARSLLPPHLAALTVLAWGVAPAVLRVTGYTRQYALLTLCTVVLALCLVHALRGESSPPTKVGRIAWRVGCGVTAACGLLTHLHFVLPLAASGMLAGLAVRKARNESEHRRAAWGVLLALGLGGVAAGALHPALLALAPGDAFDVEISAPAFGVRSLRVVAALLTFVTARTPLAYGLLALAVVAWIVAMRTRRGTENEPPAEELRTRRRLVARFTVGIVLGVVGLYLAFLSPQHAMADRYLAFVYPLLTVSFFAHLPPRAPHLILAALVCASQLTQGVLETSRHRSLWHERSDALAATGFADGPRILLDSSARGAVPTVLWHASGDALVFAASQDQLLAEPAAWLDPIADASVVEDIVYVSDLRYGNSQDQRDQILALLATRGLVAEPIPGGVYDLAALYRLSAVDSSPK
ncbi:MAG: glycosyltransferase family 39 protein [Acidobacteriota bacterium]